MAQHQGGVGDVYAAPRAPSALAPAYRRAIGDITLNLRKLPTREPGTLAAETSVGIGSIRLELPANVTATIDVWIGAGGLDVVADVAPASHPAPFASGFALHRVIRVAPVPGLPVSWQDRTRFRITARVGRGCVRIVQPRGSISGGCF